MTCARTLVLATVLASGSSLGWAQAVTKPGKLMKVSATIQQIDSTNRILTFKADDGSEDTLWAPPEMKRFNELKVGDRVNFTYYESTVYRLRKPGDPAPSPSDQHAIVGTAGDLPGGTASRQKVSSVTVKSVDPATPSITVTTADGRTITRTVADAANLVNVRPGDSIDITYTEAVLANIERNE
jgi:hypothetical protein